MTRAAAIIGASGGIGGALAEALREEGAYDAVYAFSRGASDADRLDLDDEESVRAAAQRVAGGPSLELIVVATGLLHEGGRGPEKSLSELDPEWMLRYFAVNSVGPAIAAKHFLPLLPVDRRAVFAVLSARVGSIGDNRLGGWYGYRASKAALNMFVRTASVELARTRPRAIIVGLHPGTVDTGLSKPFQRNVAPGKLFTPATSAAHLLDVIDALKRPDSGNCLDWGGETIPP
ncbi:MAG TPA: SDR family NAD(P)-dependent oxidoreductase [Sphingomonadaceae bacterium]|nr:SDR family NAD(P)-dependent oxidoreductase [Sphingomonadaceae bacterium]